MQTTDERRQGTSGLLKFVIVMAVLSTVLSLALLAYILVFSKAPATTPAPLPQPTYMDAGTNQAAQNEIRVNQQRLAQASGGAKVIDVSDVTDKKITLTIDGMLDDVTMMQILDLFKRHEATATFFISGMQATTEPAVVKALAAAGQPIGNYTLRARAHMEAFPATELVEDFSISSSIFQQLLGHKPPLLKANATTYTEDFLAAAHACGFEGVVKSTEFLTYHSFRSYEEVLAYVNSLSYGSIVSVKLSGLLDPSEYTPKEIIEIAAIDLQPGAETDEKAVPTLSKEERLLNMIDWLLKAIDEANFSPETVEMRQLNEGKLAEPLPTLHTTDASVGYAFCGIKRIDELIGVLDALDAQGGVGTFFVTAKEIEEYPEQVEMLIARGQAIGIAAYPKQNEEFYAVCHNLLRAKNLLEQSGYRGGTHLVLQPWGEIGDALKEATSAMQMELVTYDLAFARTENQQARSAQEVIDGIYKGGTYGLTRGMVVLFRMNYFDRSGLIPELLQTIRQTRNTYAIKDIYLLWQNSEMIYTYPLADDAILPEVRAKIYPGQLTGDVVDRAATHYIGNRDIISRDQFPDFSQAEIRKLDKSGRVNNPDNAAFLTFDDWGTDVNITKLLAVLEKHNVKATFFVRTEFVPNNPNLLRAIALAGHEIASHTHTHMPLAHDPLNNWRFSPITEEEALLLQQDMQTSYAVLESIIGDIRLDNGKPALSLLLRPPTMAVSRMGMWAVFDSGFTYIVNGSFTTRDYQAVSAERLARDLRNSVRAGSVVILHMTDNSIYTADAVDQYLTYLEENPGGTPLTFARLSDYLGE